MIADAFDVFLVDLDGVVYVGEEPIPSAVTAIERLRDRGKTVRFLTNNSRRPRSDLAEHLAGFGVPADPEDVVSAGSVTGDVLGERGHERVFVVGTDGLERELRDQGFDVSGDTGTPDAVVVGLDTETTYRDIELGARAVRNGAAFVAANVDPRFPTEEGLAPGTGAIVSAIETVAETGPVVVGKPEPRIFERALAGFGSVSDAVMVGDSLRSDVLGAQRVGIPSVLVTEHGVDSAPSGEADSDSDSDSLARATPDYVVGDLTDLFDSV